jgi:dihydrofolate synthase/folylpolyglutamate synthase
VEAKKYSLDLNGIYQQKNLRTTLTAIEELKHTGFKLEDEKITSALSNVKKITGLHGRWDVISQQPMIVLDVAHNEDGIKQLLHQLALCSYKNLHIIFGMVKDKDADRVLRLLPKYAKYYFTKAQIPRALDETELQTKAKGYNLMGSAYEEVNKAMKAAIGNAFLDDLILVCGSVFIVGEVNV